MQRVADVERDERDDRVVASLFRSDPRTVWASEARPRVMRVRNLAGAEVEIPLVVFERIYKRV
jgi:hypothetical protein